MKIIKNKYYKWYQKLIENAKYDNRTYNSSLHEKHHIIPKSLNGGNDSENIVFLNFREHYISHLLLTKFTSGKDKMKMCFALHTFFNFHYHRPDFKYNSYLYEQHKKMYVIACQNRIQYSKPDIFNFKNLKTNESFIGTRLEFRHYSNLTAQEISHLTVRCIDITHPLRHIKSWGIYIKEHNIYSYEKKSKLNVSVMHKNKICEHCNKQISIGNYGRWHGNNCKVINPTQHYNNTRQVASINKK